MDDRTIQEVNLVRLAIDALQGMQSALLRLENISSVFVTQSADRTSNKISSFWDRFSSTVALGKILKSIVHTGSLVFVLHKFVDHFTSLNFNQISEITAENSDSPFSFSEGQPPYSLVNHSFAVAVDKVLKGYTCSLDTVYASVCFRRSLFQSDDLSNSRNSESYLTTIAQPELTFLDVYLHTRELCTQIEALGYLCDLHDVATRRPFMHDEVPSELNQKFTDFHRGARLLSYLYTQLQDSDPAHCGLLKFLFLHSWEPYSGLIRSWIFKAEAVDPFEEFLVLDSTGAVPCPGKFAKIPTSNAVPNFLSDTMVLIIRTGQQLQVLKQLLLACNLGVSGSQDLLLSWSRYADDLGHQESQISFCRSLVEVSTNARKDVCRNFLEKADVLCSKMKQFDEQAVNFLATHNADNGDENYVLAAPGDKCVDSSAAEVNADLDEIETSNPSECSKCSDSEDSPMVENSLPSLTASILSNRSGLSFLCKTDYDKMQRKSTLNPEDPGRLCTGAFDPKNLVISNTPHSALDQKSVPLLKKSELENCSGSLNILDNTSYDAFKFCETLKALRLNNGCFETLFPGHRLFDTVMNHSGKIIFDRNLSELPPKVIDYGVTLSMNPMLKRSNPQSKLDGASLCMLPCFDFSTVDDPQRAFCDKRLISGAHYATNMAIHFDARHVHATPLRSDILQPNEINRKNSKCDTTKIDVGPFGSQSVKCDQRCENGSGSGWESLLCMRSFNNKPNTRTYNHSVSEMPDFPLHTVIEKCVIQEIYLQYCCVSKLSLKLLENGFDLLGHFLALRRYYFMEVADWADLFVASLWRYKWHEVRSEQVPSVLQRLLMSSIQRSSCERDPKRNLLFISINEGVAEPTLHPIGVYSFDFFYLGYKISWPVNFVLTPSALEIYAKIFSFLIKVKVSVFALNDVWKLLKEMKRNRSHVFGKELQHFFVLIQTRHKLNHFLTSLQQYLQFQLSQVSWCQFIDSLRQKVKDMMDLECAHATYLTDSLNKCFLSEDTVTVRTLIESILHSCSEFRQCVFAHQLPAITISRVIALRNDFDSSMNKLRACQNRTDSSLRCLWECLSNNEFYFDLHGER